VCIRDILRFGEIRNDIETVVYGETVTEFPIGSGINNRAILRFLLLFLDLGLAYQNIKPDAPYVRACTEHGVDFSNVIKHRLLAHIASRYREVKG
jgi:hypothetical protein